MSTKSKKAIVETTPVVDTNIETVESVNEILDEVPVVLEMVEQQVVENQQVIQAAEVKMTKAELARRIFNEELSKGQLVRKAVIERLMDEANLTKAGAATYFQNMRDKAGLVHHRTH